MVLQGCRIGTDIGAQFMWKSTRDKFIGSILSARCNTLLSAHVSYSEPLRAGRSMSVLSRIVIETKYRYRSLQITVYNRCDEIKAPGHASHSSSGFHNAPEHLLIADSYAGLMLAGSFPRAPASPRYRHES